jgi:hypothetical protein
VAGARHDAGFRDDRLVADVSESRFRATPAISVSGFSFSADVNVANAEPDRKAQRKIRRNNPRDRRKTEDNGGDSCTF